MWPTGGAVTGNRNSPLVTYFLHHCRLTPLTIDQSIGGMSCNSCLTACQCDLSECISQQQQAWQTLEKNPPLSKWHPRLMSAPSASSITVNCFWFLPKDADYCRSTRVHISRHTFNWLAVVYLCTSYRTSPALLYTTAGLSTACKLIAYVQSSKLAAFCYLLSCFFSLQCPKTIIKRVSRLAE